MKQAIKKVTILFATTLGFVLFSCNDDNEVESPKPIIESLLPVFFTKTAPKTLGSKKTGEFVYDPFIKMDMYEYVTTVEKPYEIAPILVATPTNNNVLFPGSILKGGAFMKGKYEPVSIKNVDKITPIPFFVTLNGNKKVNYNSFDVNTTIKPTKRIVEPTISVIVFNERDKIDYEFTPAVYHHESSSISTIEGCKQILNIHTDSQTLENILKTKFGYTKKVSSNLKRKYVMVSFKHSLYNASVDAQYSKWVKEAIDPKTVGEYEPVYVSNVAYGRIGYVLIETQKSARYIKKMMKASLINILGYSDSYAEYVKELKSLFSENKIRFMINGGPVELGGQVDSYESFKKFVQMPNAQNLAETSVPISYKIRRLKDDTKVKMYDTYTESFIELKEN